GFETFHPTFLYESLGNLIVVGLILWVERRFPAIRGKLLALYLVGYGMLRFGMELLRTDTTFRFLGLSRNAWVSLGVILVGIVVAARLEPIDRQPLGGLGPGRAAPTATCRSGAARFRRAAPASVRLLGDRPLVEPHRQGHEDRQYHDHPDQRVEGGVLH